MIRYGGRSLSSIPRYVLGPVSEWFEGCDGVELVETGWGFFDNVELSFAFLKFFCFLPHLFRGRTPEGVLC